MENVIHDPTGVIPHPIGQASGHIIVNALDDAQNGTRERLEEQKVCQILAEEEHGIEIMAETRAS